MSQKDQEAFSSFLSTLKQSAEAADGATAPFAKALHTHEMHALLSPKAVLTIANYIAALEGEIAGGAK